MSERPDWPAIMPAILRQLEAAGLIDSEHRREHGREVVRFGRRGSLCVDLARGLWRDHEAGSGGGALALVERCIGDRGRALDWLADRGLIERSRGPERPRKRRSRPGGPVAPAAAAAARPADPGKPEPDGRALAILAAAGPIPPRPHPVYRWRAGLIDASREPLPLRWIEADALAAVAGTCPAPLAAGAILSPRAPLADWLADRPQPAAVECEYVGENGEHVADRGGLRKRTYGPARGAVWSTGPGARGRLHLAEGVADALAVALHLRCGEDAVATGGTAGLRAAALAAAAAGRALVIHADGDGPGADAAREAIRLFRRDAPGVEVRWLRWSPDPDGERREKRRRGEPLILPAWLYDAGEAAASDATPAA